MQKKGCSISVLYFGDLSSLKLMMIASACVQAHLRLPCPLDCTSTCIIYVKIIWDINTCYNKVCNKETPLYGHFSIIPLYNFPFTALVSYNMIHSHGPQKYYFFFKKKKKDCAVHVYTFLIHSKKS